MSHVFTCVCGPRGAPLEIAADVLAVCSVCSLTSTTATRAHMSKRPAAGGDAPSKQAKVATSEPGLPNLLPPHWKNEIARYLEVDMPKWDVGGFVVGDAPHHAMLLGKAPGVLAGVPFATHAIELAGCEVEWLVPEGHVISAEDAKAKRPVAKVTGPTRCILMAERTALNILSRASGVATAAHAAMEVARARGC